MDLNLELELLTVVESAATALLRVLVHAPGIMAVNLPGPTEDEDAVLIIAEDGLLAGQWVAVLQHLPPTFDVVVDGELEIAADWLTTMGRLLPGAPVWLDQMPSPVEAREFRHELEDGVGTLLPRSFEPLDW